LTAGLAIAVTRPPPVSARALAVTLLLAAACLIKPPIVPVLALWLWWLTRAERRALPAHLAAVVVLSLACLTPYLAGWHTLAPLVTSGGLEAWASPSHLVGQGAEALVAAVAGSAAGAHAAAAVEIAFLVLFAAAAWQLRDRAPADSWGIALLLLALSLPYLLPWYAAWFAPLLGLLAAELLLAGALVTGVLALTLIPADPFHGLTSPAVLNGVHYGAASVLLVVLLFVLSRVLGRGAQAPVALLGSG
ncbi:MAG: hypothetical protein ACXVZN_10885, partial [Gaiellaceae bacterium]